MSPSRIRGTDGTLLEAGWQKQVVELAKLGGWTIFHAPDNRPGRRNGRPQQVVGDTVGFPDLVLIRRNEMLVVELKTDKGRVGPGQREWLDRFRSMGDAIDHVVGKYPDYVSTVPGGLPSIESHLWRPRDIFEVERRLAVRTGKTTTSGTKREDAGA